jgi:hypothetical protein
MPSSYERGIMLTGLLFLHRISDNRMAKTLLQNTQMFEKLCGSGALQNVIFVTTMWDEVDELTGSMREEKLRANVWASMIASGSQMARFDATYRSAWQILDQLNGVHRPLQLQVEMVDEKKALAQTAAGFVLFQLVDRFITQFRAMIIALRLLLHRTPIPSEAASYFPGEKVAGNQQTKGHANHATYFIHSTAIPTFNMTLYEALVVDLPLCGNALDCIRADTDHVNNVVEVLSTMIRNAEIRQASFSGHGMIYRVRYRL